MPYPPGPLKESVQIYERTIKNIEVDLERLQKMMKKTLKSDKDIWARVENLMTRQGVGFKTVALTLGETQGFALIKTKTVSVQLRLRYDKERKRHFNKRANEN
ncbi:MAG: hypothetical protein ACJA1A_001463 [Saprospiraceae bacterium]|jgi:hypothetical protein|tara:strand:+ start:226 stop:534 length:309 start_codon:yes stop_codon:yes gene_type:complete